MRTDCNYGTERRETNVSLKLENEFFFSHKDFLVTSNSRTFDFDLILDQTVDNTVIYENIVKTPLKACINLTTENTIIFYEKASLERVYSLILKPEKTTDIRNQCLLGQALSNYFKLVKEKNLFYMKCRISVACLKDNNIFDLFKGIGVNPLAEDEKNNLAEILVSSKEEGTKIIFDLFREGRKFLQDHNFLFTLHFEKEITKYGKIIHVILFYN